MKKQLLLFGAGGSLGTGAAEYFLKSAQFDHIYLFDKSDLEFNQSNTKFIKIFDLTEENNVEKAFSSIEFNENDQYFLFSTVGGFAGGKDVGETELTDFDKMMNLNIKISFLLAKYFIKMVQSTSGGAICFTSAMAASSPSKGKAVYGSSKYALNYIVKTLAQECKKFGISVNAVAPLVIDTKANREWVEDDTIMVSPTNIAGVVGALFENRRVVSGNIIELPGTLK